MTYTDLKENNHLHLTFRSDICRVLPSHQYQDVEHNGQEDVGPVPNVAEMTKP